MTDFFTRLACGIALMLVLCASSIAAPWDDEVDPAGVRPFTNYGANLSAFSVSELERKGDAAAFNELGRRYGVGEGVARDSPRAKAYYQKAAESGRASGQCNLAFMHLNGEGTPKDDKQALHWFRKCAAQGHYGGARELGSFYATGSLGLPRNGPRAEAWYLVAAKQGHLPAQEALWAMYTYGLPGLSADPERAALWKKRFRTSFVRSIP